MRLSIAAGCLVAAWICAQVAHAQAASPSTQASIAGLELERDDQGVRLLVFASGALDFRVSEPDAATLVLHFPGASLGAGAERRIDAAAGPIAGVTAFETAAGAPAEVQVVIQRTGDVAPEVSRRGSIVAVRFALPPLPGPDDDGAVVLHYENAALADVVRELARATGERILFDAELTGRISVLGPERVQPRDAQQVLEAVLRLRGLAAVEAPGGMLKVVPIEGAPAAAASPEGSGTSEVPVAIVLPLHHAAPEQVLPLLEPLEGDAVVTLPQPTAAGLVLVGPERRVRQLIGLVSTLDQPGLDELDVRRLRHHSAREAAELLEAAFAGTGFAATGLGVWADERSNALVLRAHPALREDAQRFLDALDRPVQGEGALRVFALKHADPEWLADTLRTLARGEEPGPLPFVEDAGEAGADAASPLGELAGRPLQVAVHRSTRSLLVHADPETARIAEAIVEALDRAPTTVEVEVAVAEVELSDSLALGFDFVLPLTNPNSADDAIARIISNPSGGGLRSRAGAGRNGLARFTRQPVEIPLVGPDGEPFTVLIPRESFALTVDQGEVRGRVLMRPHLRMLSGEEQVLFAGNNVPVPVAQDGSPSLEVRQDVERRDVGLRLRVRPMVGSDGGVDLDLDLELSRVIAGSFSRAARRGVAEQGPLFRQRKIQSEVHLRDDAWVLVAMAHEPRRVRSEVGTPFLSALPLIGRAFRTSEERTFHNHLLVSVRARVHSEDSRLEQSVRLGLGRDLRRSRLQGLAEEQGSGAYALRAATLRLRSAAERMASQLDARGLRARIVEWTDRGRARFDVYCTGFSTLASAVGEALRLPLPGTSPQVVALPES